MAPTVRQSVAKVLGVELHSRRGIRGNEVTRGESTISITNSDSYVDAEPSVLDWVVEITPTPRAVGRYFSSLFPFIRWVPRYNAQWLLGDVVAGITVGAVVVPQGMAYASLAALPPQFGLYSSFMGLLVYWFFATSKDITIGPVAVMSTIVGNVVLKIRKTNPEIPGHVVASALAVIAGSIILFIGLIRCGWIVDFISLAAISAFMTGSAINIAVGQAPSLMGITGFSSRGATYEVIINTLKNLDHTRLDAAMGLTALLMLYSIRIGCHIAARRLPSRRNLFNFLATLRVAFVILLYVLISWLVNRHHRSHPKFSILGAVPRGFQNAGVPTINTTVIKTFASELPPAVIVLLIEHIAIAKSFGRVNHYAIDPSQEMVAIGLTNLLGPFLGAYPTTGSFSRTAINSKAGVRTPGGGLVSALVVLLAIYALPAVFFYIPNASLSAVIIHAVGDLITSPDTIYQFWKVSPFEVLIFFAGVIVTVFSSIEDGIYTTICVSVAMLLFRFAKAKGAFLGKIKVHSVVGDRLLPEHGKIEREGALNKNAPELAARNVFVPLDHKDGLNPELQIETPYPGIFIYRFSEGFNFPNATHYLDHLTSTIYRSTRRGDISGGYLKPGDRPWNDVAPLPEQEAAKSDLPTLEAVILDFSSVNNVDITSVQHLIDVRNQLDRWAAPDVIEWHIASITNRWTRRALVHAGFGYPTPNSPQYHRWKPVFSVAEIGGFDSAANTAQVRYNETLRRRQVRETQSRQAGVLNENGRPGGPHHRHSSTEETTASGAGIASITKPGMAAGQSSHLSNPYKFNTGPESEASAEDLEMQITSSTAYARTPKVTVVSGLDKPLFHIVDGLNRPLFHIGLTSALQSAIHSVELKRDSQRVAASEDTVVEL